jgi:hypothetical protein
MDTFENSYKDKEEVTSTKGTWETSGINLCIKGMKKEKMCKLFYKITAEISQTLKKRLPYRYRRLLGHSTVKTRKK